MTLYFITDWNDLYENNHSRIVKNLKWVPIPNRHDGESYASIMAHKDGAKIFAAWVLILQVASRCEPRGDLLRGTKEPHDSGSLALRTRAPADWFEKAIPFLLKCGWLSRKQLPESELALVCNDIAPSRNQPVDEQKGIEEKEEKRKKDKEAASPTPLPFDSASFRSAWEQFAQHRREIRKPLTPTASKLTLEQLERIGEDRAIAAIRHTIAKGWQGIREPDGPQPTRYSPPKPQSKECPGWKTILNHEFPESVYSAGGASEAHDWSKLPPEAQRLCWDAYRKQGVSA